MTIGTRRGYGRTVSSLGYPEASLEDFLRLAGKHGLKTVELRALGGTIDLPAYLTNLAGSPSGLSEYLRRSDIRINALATSLRILDATAADREAFLKFVPWAEALEVPLLRVFDGGKTVDPTELSRAAETAEWWRKLKASNGWKTNIAVETHDSLVTTPLVNRFLGAVPGIPILWDTHHTWKKGGEDPVTTWRAIGPHVVHIHVKDSVSQPSAKHPFTYVLPGFGEFPMGRLAPVLSDEFKGLVCLEWEKLWHPYLPPLDEALAVATAKNWW